MREGGWEQRPGSNGGYSKWVASFREREGLDEIFGGGLI